MENTYNPIKLAHCRLLATEAEKKIEAGICPECNCKLTFSEGCNICRSCGWSGCGN